MRVGPVSEPRSESEDPDARVITVSTEEECAVVLEAVAGGAALEVRVEGLEPTVAARFAEDLRRAGSARLRADPPSAPQLTEAHVALLASIGRGATVAAAAAELGIGARSASRRLAEARAILGVSSTAEAVLRTSRTADGARPARSGPGG
jgi:DNA-binding NarL/FixJ family response regulator